jgi:hypothetical protein
MSRNCNTVLELSQSLVDDLRRMASDRGVTVSRMIEIILTEVLNKEMEKKYTGKVLEICDNGDAIIELPDDLIADIGWQIGDELSIDQEDGLIVIRNLTVPPLNSLEIKV